MRLGKPYYIKRAIFMVVVMFPILVVLEYTGNTSTVTTVLLAGITSGVSVVLFPDPEHLKKIEEAEKNEKIDNK
ncbi:MAG: hypothetical protein J6Z11_13935 [Candidatus Riflebacteria bacterium]|nr:hypothetical protein [Candidatus Riflebacteria bacterium]